MCDFSGSTHSLLFLFQQKTDPDVILCNAVEMIRERLNVSEDGKKEHREKEDEYVYDIYYMETSAPGWIENILSVQPYREEYELVRMWENRAFLNRKVTNKHARSPISRSRHAKKNPVRYYTCAQ